jgi:hypothetical protein
MRAEITATIKQLNNWRNENVKGISGTPESADECPRQQTGPRAVQKHEVELKIL